ncbi:MAG TPA: hypothetical protein VHB97_26345 [Polyangia bacterium]|jgi:hypothetical protein|nr:hypothetical protein [Polyangia bacterium]
MRTIALLTLLAFSAPASAADENTPVTPPPVTTPSPLAPPAPPPPPATPATAPEPTGIQEPPPEPPPPAPVKPVTAPPPPVSSRTVLPVVPEVPDEPLPEWTPPPPTPKESRRALFLQMSPEVQQAQHLRQAGLWISGIGWAAVLSGGILYAHTSDNTVVQGIGAAGADQAGGISHIQVNTGIGLMISGGAVAAIGFAIFTAGQWQLSAWHKKRPTDTMPSMSGF